jgi:hypothetical protein
VPATAAAQPPAPAATPKPATAAGPTAAPAPPAKTEPTAQKTAASPAAKPSPLATNEGEPPKAQQPAAVSSNAPALPPRRPLLFAEAAPLGLLSPGANRLGPAIDALAQLRLQPYATSSVSLFGFIPLWQADLERDAGKFKVRAWAIGGFADLHVPMRPVELSAGLGVASMLISIRATARSAAAVDGELPKRLPLFLGRVGASLRLTRDLRLTARVMAGLLAPDGLQIEIGGQPVASWGRLLVLGSLGLELALPWER